MTKYRMVGDQYDIYNIEKKLFFLFWCCANVVYSREAALAWIEKDKNPPKPKWEYIN